ncbi:uncharacterized protein LOC122000525 [Zingiber officinale]|uniref:Uncharacterized protein n=1 Tax=Zingiber officinale TaxID=94328 RepID=A0A8J5KN70_ZINOF|nr:uncharacterized protein LOC122000525 [Zingiber officinale]KAG6494161.1 hypothetical protein ZIOFF_049180 [Zingiber officinale]
MGVDSWCLEELAMDASFPSLWGFHESMEELKQKLLCTTLELEALKANAEEEVRRGEQSIGQLLILLQMVTRERDEARGHLKLLLSELSQMAKARELCRSPMPESITPDLCDSSAGGSSEFSSTKLATNTASVDYDRASATVNRLAVERSLPQKGKLLQAVLEAGPTLQTLLLAGPLPQWRNPPPWRQPFQIPPVAVKAQTPAVVNSATKRPMPMVVAPSSLIPKRQRSQCI